VHVSLCLRTRVPCIVLSQALRLALYNPRYTVQRLRTHPRLANSSIAIEYTAPAKVRLQLNEFACLLNN
jgi:hypothetical protein